MSAQRLNSRTTRRIERNTGLTIVRAWGYGEHACEFVTPDHRHGWWDSKTGEYGWDANPTHYTSCHELFPEWRHTA